MRTMKGYMHGIDLGGWFSQCDNTEKRYDYFIRRDDFRRIARWGLDHVRVPVDYNLVQNAGGSFKEKGFERIRNCWLWARENGLNMVLDLHKTLGFSFDSGEQETGFFESESYQTLFYSLWEEFARRFGDCEGLAFELLNEVTEKSYKDAWNRISLEAVRRIRKYAPDKQIIIGGYYNNDVTAVKDIAMPADANIVYTFHCYAPLVFTHQGAYWIETMDRDFRMPFTSPCREYAAYTEKCFGSEFKETFPDPDGVITPAYFENMFAEALRVAEERNVPLYCGEYGVIDLADPEEALKWYECISSVFDKYQIGRAAWSYKEMDFGLIEAHYDDVRERILKLL